MFYFFWKLIFTWTADIILVGSIHTEASLEVIQISSLDFSTPSSIDSLKMLRNSETRINSSFYVFDSEMLTDSKDLTFDFLTWQLGRPSPHSDTSELYPKVGTQFWLHVSTPVNPGHLSINKSRNQRPELNYCRISKLISTNSTAPFFSEF